MSSDLSVWHRSFDPSALLALGTKNFEKLANENPESISSFRASGNYLNAFYDALEESLKQLPTSFDTQDSYQDYQFRQQLLIYVRKIRTSKVSLNNFSHLQYLLPWDLQPLRHPNTSCGEDRLKNLLKYEISQAKFLSQSIKRHYAAQFTGQAVLNHKKGLCWTFLSHAYRNKSKIEIIIYIKKLIKYTGQILLFDLHCNLLLDTGQDHQWVYVRGSCICCLRIA